MSKAGKFIEERTKNCSNQIINGDYGTIIPHFNPWLTPDQAKRAVEIAREEVIDWIDKHWREYINVDADGVVCFGHWKNDLKQAMKDD